MVLSNLVSMKDVLQKQTLYSSILMAMGKKKESISSKECSLALITLNYPNYHLCWLPPKLQFKLELVEHLILPELRLVIITHLADKFSIGGIVYKENQPLVLHQWTLNSNNKYQGCI